MNEKGFTLIEVLVAILVLSVGLFGLGGLMITGMKNNQSSYQRTQATWLAYDMADRIRTNRSKALEEDYDVDLATTPGADTTIVETDIRAWKAVLARTLPNGRGSIDVVPADRSLRVIVEWNDGNGTGGSSAQKFQVDTLL